MPDFLTRFTAPPQSTSESWLNRVYENARQLARNAGFKIVSANGAPLHLLDLRRESMLGRAQSASILTPAAIITALAVWAVHSPAPKSARASANDAARQLTPLPPDLLRHLLGNDPSSGSGSVGIAILFRRPPGISPHFLPYSC